MSVRQRPLRQMTKNTEQIFLKVHQEDIPVSMMEQIQDSYPEFFIINGNNKEVLKNILIEAFSNDCDACSHSEKTFIGLSKSMSKKVIFLKLNTDEEMFYAEQLGIRVVPSYIHMNSEGVVKIIEGADNKSLIDYASELNKTIS